MISQNASASLAVCLWPAAPPNQPRSNQHPEYLYEILDHAGVLYRRLAFEELSSALPQVKVLITVGEYNLDDEVQTTLKSWLVAGGCWLSVSGVCNLPTVWNVEHATPAIQSAGWGRSDFCALGEGYLEPSTHKVLEHLESPLHFFNGVAIEASESRDLSGGVLDAHGRETSRLGIVENRVGAGKALLIAPDAIGTVVRVQQGISIHQDAPSFPDGTANRCDGFLKCDDGAVLDCEFDRQEVPGVASMRAFLQPVADAWREVLLRAIFYLCAEVKSTPALCWYYPRNLEAIAHLSHDTDENEPALAARLLELLQQSEIHSTWCVIAPGYDAKIIQEIHNAGHELALHYDAVDCAWSEAEFVRQSSFLKDLFGHQPVTNKNHYTRWEGGGEFFLWCEKQGIAIEQSRGPAKIGEAGFLFGTCHPHFPVTENGDMQNVLELPFASQDLGIFAPSEFGLAVLHQAKKYHGVFHLLFHPAHVGNPQVGAAFTDIVRAAKDAGLEWWTSRQINDWERARRTLQWENFAAGEGSCRAAVSALSTLRDATLLFLTDAERINVNDQDQTVRTVKRWGFTFQAVTMDIDAATT
jgi:hypothetical protein